MGNESDWFCENRLNFCGFRHWNWSPEAGMKTGEVIIRGEKRTGQ